MPSAAADLAGHLRSSRNTVVFTGAGISTESGIPDFRSPGGLWTRMKPIMFQDYMASKEVRREAWTRKFELDDTLAKARPNAGHQAIAALVEMAKVSAVITQNIDNLHQDSGIAAERIVELHGNATYAKCLACGKRYELEPVKQSFQQSGEPPVCVECDGIVKSATISFGQPMPEEEMQRASEATRACDFFIAAGSSLQVYPAAGFPGLAKKAGAKLAIINREPTDLDFLADLLIHGETGAVLSSALALLRS